MRSERVRPITLPFLLPGNVCFSARTFVLSEHRPPFIYLKRDFPTRTADRAWRRTRTASPPWNSAPSSDLTVRFSLEKVSKLRPSQKRIHDQNSTERSLVFVLAELSAPCVVFFFFFVKFRPGAFRPEVPPGWRAPDLPFGLCSLFEENQRWQARAPAGTHQRRLMSFSVQQWIIYSLWTG